jgi:hypothetical protein
MRYTSPTFGADVRRIAPSTPATSARATASTSSRGEPIPYRPSPMRIPPYRIEVAKDGTRVTFGINDLPLFDWTDDGTHGDPLTGGRIGFRQMAPLVAEYSDLVVTRLA